MKKFSKERFGVGFGIIVIALASSAAVAQKPAATKKAAPAAKHVLLPPAELKWGPAPDGLPPGAQLAVLDGDPSKPGSFAIQVKFPSGYRIPPHWHPTDENVTVLSGTLLVGMGDKMDEPAMKSLSAGGYAKMPRQMHHYAMAKAETTIQVYGTGPFAITYVNPGDDPRKKTTTTK